MYHYVAVKDASRVKQVQAEAISNQVMRIEGPSPMMFTLTGASSQHRDNQKLTSRLYLMWHVLNFVQVQV
jgi:hypothetical protein